MLDLSKKIIAVDFDGTIVEHKYPEIGKQMAFAFVALKFLQQKGHRLILWTFRNGKRLEEAVEYCKEYGIEFYAVNENFPEEPTDDERYSRKILADIFIDDRNVGGFLGWPEILKMLYPDEENFEHVLKNPEAHHNSKKRRKRGFKFW